MLENVSSSCRSIGHGVSAAKALESKAKTDEQMPKIVSANKNLDLIKQGVRTCNGAGLMVFQELKV